MSSPTLESVCRTVTSTIPDPLISIRLREAAALTRARPHAWRTPRAPDTRPTMATPQTDAIGTHRRRIQRSWIRCHGPHSTLSRIQPPSLQGRMAGAIASSARGKGPGTASTWHPPQIRLPWAQALTLQELCTCNKPGRAHPSLSLSHHQLRRGAASCRSPLVAHFPVTL